MLNQAAPGRCCYLKHCPRLLPAGLGLAPQHRSDHLFSRGRPGRCSLSPRGLHLFSPGALQVVSFLAQFPRASHLSSAQTKTEWVSSDGALVTGVASSAQASSNNVSDYETPPRVTLATDRLHARTSCPSPATETESTVITTVVIQDAYPSSSSSGSSSSSDMARLCSGSFSTISRPGLADTPDQPSAKTAACQSPLSEVLQGIHHNGSTSPSQSTQLGQDHDRPPDLQPHQQTSLSLSAQELAHAAAAPPPVQDPYVKPLPADMPNPPLHAPPSLLAWGALLLLSVSYMHQATNSFALPAMLPAISSEMHFSDLQGALLTTGYSYLYALAMLPVGLLADRVHRPKMLAVGVASWSALTLLTSGARSFTELLTARVGFAAAQAIQNPISFALIPELFPRNKSAALALYNCAIYLGRALAFGAALAAERISDHQAGLAAMVASTPDPAVVVYVPLDKLDLSLVSILYTQGDYAAIIPNFHYSALTESLTDEVPVQAVMDAANTSWREVLGWVAAPGFLIALALVLALPEPRTSAQQRKQQEELQQQAGVKQLLLPLPPPPPQQQQQAVAPQPDFLAGLLQPRQQQQQQQQQHATARQPNLFSALLQPRQQQRGASQPNFVTLLRSPRFMYTTLAASFNDVGSYALMAFQSTFYERVYHLDPSAYAPVLAVVLPMGGIIGGVGGGWIADKAAASGRRAWMTAGATGLAAPLMLLSLLAPTSEQSFLALLVGFLLSEAWRAPGANMARSTAPAELGSSTISLYLCIRNLVGGLGPLAVVLLTQLLDGDLQKALLVVPAAFLTSASLFMVAEAEFAKEQQAVAKRLVEGPASSSSSDVEQAVAERDVVTVGSSREAVRGTTH